LYRMIRRPRLPYALDIMIYITLTSDPVLLQTPHPMRVIEESTPSYCSKTTTFTFSQEFSLCLSHTRSCGEFSFLSNCLFVSSSLDFLSMIVRLCQLRCSFIPSSEAPYTVSCLFPCKLRFFWKKIICCTFVTVPDIHPPYRMGDNHPPYRMGEYPVLLQLAACSNPPVVND
jgi:hypothetical protein